MTGSDRWSSPVPHLWEGAETIRNSIYLASMAHSFGDSHFNLSGAKGLGYGRPDVERRGTAFKSDSQVLYRDDDHTLYQY